MGTFNCSLKLESMDGERSIELDALVDTGALYTTVPARLLMELDVTPRGRRRFLLADGRRVEMDFGDARVTIDGEQAPTLVVFGEDDDLALLGAHTLQGLGLAVDPTEHRLVPATLLMCSVAHPARRPPVVAAA